MPGAWAYNARMSPDMTLVQKIAIWALPVLFAITLHEVAHGWVARLLGDRTAQMLGRLSLNPLRHIDPVGTVLLPIAMLVMQTGFMFGWAKPVPVSMKNLKHPRRDMALVAAAGPLSNALMALLWGLLLRLSATMGAEGAWIGVQYMALAGIAINLVLMVLNFLPIPPLDGSRVLAGLLPESGARMLDRIEPYGFVILILLMVTPVLGAIMSVPLHLASQALAGVLGFDSLPLF
jgi:Zn-dependent protease